MKINEQRIRNIIRQVIREQTEEAAEIQSSIEVAPTHDCVDSHFDQFQKLGQKEQQAYYKAFDTCADRSVINTDTLTVIHWFNLYEGSVIDLINDFSKWVNKTKMKFSGAISAVGYDNFQQRRGSSMVGKIGFVLDGPISLAFRRDAETERGGIFPTKMPGKLSGGISNDPADYIKYMVLGADTYGMPNDTKSTNEFILINPNIKQIIIDVEWFGKDIEKFGADKDGNTIGVILKNLATTLLGLNIPITDLDGNDAKSALNDFANMSTDPLDMIIKTLIGEKEMIGRGLYGPNELNLFRNVTKLKAIPNMYPGMEYWTGDIFRSSMKDFHEKGKLAPLLNLNSTEEARVIDNYFFERPYYGAGGETMMLDQLEFIRKYLNGTPLYYKKIDPTFKLENHNRHGSWQAALIGAPWLDQVEKFMYWVGMEEYGGWTNRSPIEETLIPFLGVVEYDNFSLENLPVPPNTPPNEDKAWVGQMKDGATFYFVDYMDPSSFKSFQKLLSHALIYTRE